MRLDSAFELQLLTGELDFWHMFWSTISVRGS